MSLRLRRLANEEQMLRDQFADHRSVSVRPTRGDPPDRYRVEYRVGGLERRSDGSLVVRNVHEMEIVLPAEYPRQPAACRMLTPVFHPNIDTFSVCTSDFHAAQETLCDLIVRVGQMISFQKHNVKSPLNAEAAIWCEENLARLPVDGTDIYPASMSQTLSPPRACNPPEPRDIPPPRASPPPFPTVPPSDKLDSVTLKLISPPDSTVPSSGLIAEVGTVVTLGSVRCMIAMQHDPPRIEIHDMDGNDIVQLPLCAACSGKLGGASIRIVGTHQTSLARIGNDQTHWPLRSPDVATFWNGVVQTQATLSARTKRLIEMTNRSDSHFPHRRTHARESLERCAWLIANAPAHESVKSLLRNASARLRETLDAVGHAL